MYFEIENTPEHIRRARRTETIAKKSPNEECPRLELAPFSRAPKVIFDNVIIGTQCEKNLEIYNPLKREQQITLGRELPPGLKICLPGEWLLLEPETCYFLTLIWTPTQPTSLRETIRFIDDARGRYDVVVILKAIIKEKPKNVKVLKKSPGKIKKKIIKKSPVLISKKKEKIIFSESRLKKVDISQATLKYKSMKVSNKENILTVVNDYSLDYQAENNPFDTQSNDFRISEIFPNSNKHSNEEHFQLTYDKIETLSEVKSVYASSNILKPSNIDNSVSDIFDNLTFTPLKSTHTKNSNLEKGTNIVFSSLNCSKDSLEIIKKKNEVDGTHSIICTTPLQDNNWLNIASTNDNVINDVDEPKALNSKIPNTSSPKELYSPNFTINTDISFIPQRFSTEIKTSKISSVNYHEMHDDTVPNDKLNSDTYTKSYSPNNPHLLTEHNVQTHAFLQFARSNNTQKNKNCKQSLFKEPQKEFHCPNFATPSNSHIFPTNRSPRRSLTPPPLQSIPEESTNYSYSDTFDRTNTKMRTFTMNRTFDKPADLTTSGKQTWSKKSIRCEPEIWKVPVSCPRKTKKTGETKVNKEKTSDVFRQSAIHSTSNVLNVTDNVYSQSFTVDPFSSSTYFYDEQAVAQFETEFKRWLNYILTPPADLDSNIEHKIDIGKAWLENRNKEIPFAPTKEKVSSMYHNSHRLESLRKSARVLIKSPEIKQALLKLYMQIDKKLIAIRNDRNLHLDVGLQKIIMELILCYNPLWLRIGLEAIYDVVVPLKSNSDIEGLTMFIVQNMFKNPKMKSKQSRPNMPNMLLPAYLEALKKFTLKKFFTLVFFLDRAKQMKLISHDPCLFCRNAICKESREVLLRFTKELIAGIGDITKHLRPLGYVVNHKQSYIDEYKYAVHNIAIDMRDGVRLTKVMEIILLKSDLMSQLRTPPISRLQKIHNVQVALTALKKADFSIVGDITAIDIADGHREKTLSLLWQIIHVFRAPLFENAANIIQTWWRKKYEVIAAEKKKQQLIQIQLNSAATVIQSWWKRILCDRVVQFENKKRASAAIIVQKYCKMWLNRKRFLRLKQAVFKVEKWYIDIQKVREAKVKLGQLRKEREELKKKSAIIIQSAFRRWQCIKNYQDIKKKVVCIQSYVRKYLHRNKYLKLRQTVINIQQRHRNKVVMRKEMQRLAEIRKSAIKIQSYYRMTVQRKSYEKLKNAVQTVETRYIAHLQMKRDRAYYMQLKTTTILLQSYVRAKKAVKEYSSKRKCIITVQIRIKATLLMRKQRKQYIKTKNAINILQKRIKAHLEMIKVRRSYLQLRESTIIIQRYFKSYLIVKAERAKFVQLKMATLILQRRYRSLVLMRIQRQVYLKLKRAALTMQSRFRATIQMREERAKYLELLKAIKLVQIKYKALLVMREQRNDYLRHKLAAKTIQNAFRAYLEGKKQRQEFLHQKDAIIKIQRWYRETKHTKRIKGDYQRKKISAIVVQRAYRTYVIRTEYIKIRKAVVTIQKYFKLYKESKIIRNDYLQKRNSCVIIQRAFRSLKSMQTQRQDYVKTRNSIILIQRYFRQYIQTKITRESYCKLKQVTINIQRKYRSLLLMRKEREQYLKFRNAATTLQQHYRSVKMMKNQREQFKTLQLATIIIQRQFRAQMSMRNEKTKYLQIRSACVTIQRAFRAHLLGKTQRNLYLKWRNCALIIQNWYRRTIRSKIIQKKFLQIRRSACIIQKWYKTILIKREIRRNQAARKIQLWYKLLIIKNKQRNNFLKIKKCVIVVQSIYRMYADRKEFLKVKKAVIKIQSAYRSYKLAKLARHDYLKYRNSIIKVQSYVRSYFERKRYIKLKMAAQVVQRHYRLKKYQEALRSQEQKRRLEAAICIQKYVRRYIASTSYNDYRAKVMHIQKMWRGILIGRLIRCDFLQKRRFIIKLQSRIRGYLVRKQVEQRKQEIMEVREQQKIYWAASKIQALFRAHHVRVKTVRDKQVTELRRRWRAGALRSNQESLRERNEDVLDILKNKYNIEVILGAFKDLEYLTEVYPMMYNLNADLVVELIFEFTLTTNRSISSVDVLMLSARILVNLTRYTNTALQIYKRERISITLKFMLRFSNTETDMFCIFCTFLWLFAKYDHIREDLTEFLQAPENRKILLSIKSKIERMKRMTCSAVKNRPTAYGARHSQNLNQSMKVGNPNLSLVLPALQPDYGILRQNKPRYFEDAHHAIKCLFKKYHL